MNIPYILKNRLYLDLESMDPAVVKAFSSRIKSKSYPPEAMITLEGEPATDFQIILEGQVRVTQDSEFGKLFVCILNKGDIIGITPAKLCTPPINPYHRTADTQAVTKVKTASIALNDLNDLLVIYPQLTAQLQQKQKAIAIDHFVRYCCQGATLADEALNLLCQQTDVVEFKSDQIIFQQHDQADYVYAVLSGELEVSKITSKNEHVVAAHLGADTIFGEIAVTSGSKRNATIVSKSDCVLLRIQAEIFCQFLSQSSSAYQLISVMRDSRIRPKLIDDIIYHTARDRDGSQSMVLEHPHDHHFIEIPIEYGAMLTHLNGDYCLKDIFNILSQDQPSMNVTTLQQIQYQLITHQFVHCPKMQVSAPIDPDKPKKWLSKVTACLTAQHEFHHINEKLDRLYQAVGKPLFHWTTQSIVLLIILFGLLFTFHHYQSLATLTLPSFLVAILIAVALSSLNLLGHELAHGLMTNHLGGQCYRGGIGWHYINAIAYIDTSSMWNKPLLSRLKVNVAGIWFNLFFAGLLLIPCGFALVSHFWGMTLLLFAMFSYVTVLANLSSLLEYDGYYMLADIFETPQLKQQSFTWIKQFFKRLLKQKINPFKGHAAHVIYWIYTSVHLLLFFVLIQCILSRIILPIMGFGNIVN